MTDTNNDFIDPKLTAALQHWSDFYTQNTQDIMKLINWMNPEKDAQQLTTQFNVLLKSTDWQSVMNNWMSPALFWGSFQGAYSELEELNKVTAEACVKAGQQLLEMGQQATDKLSSVAQNPANPQEALAAYLETSLEIAKTFQEVTNQQSEEMSGLQTARKVWFERTLTGQNADKQ